MATTRKTTQQVRILEHLKSTNTHPTAEEVYKAAVKQLPTITLATVYRNLNKLTEQGQIVRIKVDGSYRYDAREGDHIHGICKDTGKIVDIDQPEIVRYVRKKVKHKGFTPREVSIIITGTCNDEVNEQ